SPISEFDATPLQPPPPSEPGNTRLGTMPYGVYGPMLTDLSKTSRQYCSASGEIVLSSPRVMLLRASPTGLTGYGWVGHASSPGASNIGTGRSSTLNSGLPVRRLNMTK